VASKKTSPRRQPKNGQEAVAELEQQADEIRAKTDRPIAELTDEELAWEGTGLKPITSLGLSHKSFPELQWIVPGVIPEGTTLLAGKPKAGKSYLALAVAGAVSVGTKALGSIDVAKRKVVYFAFEDGERRLARRQEQLRILPSENLTFITSWDGKESIITTLDRLFEKIDGIGLCVLDPLAAVRSSSQFSNDQFQVDYDLMRAIKGIGDRHGVSQLVVCHTRKALAEDPLDQVLGTRGHTAGADTILVLQRNKAASDAELAVISRDVEGRELALRQDPYCGWTLLGDAALYRQSRQRRQIIEALEETGEEMRVKDIAAAADVDYKAASKLLGKLCNDGLIQKGQYGRYACINKKK